MAQMITLFGQGGKEMFGKMHFTWSGSEQKSIQDIVSEEGVRSGKEILYLIRKLCAVLEMKKETEIPTCLLPQNIFLNSQGELFLSMHKVGFSLQEPYYPPEQMRAEGSQDSHIYNLGMLMLFMAVGDADKSKLDALVEDKALKEAIERCTSFDPGLRFQSTRELLSFLARKKRRWEKWIASILILVSIAMMITLLLYLYTEGEQTGEAAGRESGYMMGYAGGYEKGFADAPSIGLGLVSYDSTRGNLFANVAAGNGAFLAQSEEEIFFIHQQNIYRMNPYTEKIKLLVENAEAFHLSYYDGWLYYSGKEKVFRIHPLSLKQEVFCEQRSGLLYIEDGEFYLDVLGESGYLYKVNPQTGELRQLNGITDYHCFHIADKRIYYTDKENDDAIYRCDLDGSNRKLVSSNRYEWICLHESRIYGYTAGYEKAEQRSLDSPVGFLIHTDLEGGSMQKVGHTPAAYLNVTSGGIYYVAGQNRRLEWMSFDGRTHYTIVPTTTGPFNLAGHWIFYVNEEDNGNLWRVRVDGSKNKKVEEK